MLKTIVLIDDDEATNFWHKIILEKNNSSKEIAVFSKADQALEYLKSPDPNGALPVPELIFLDLNIPGMTGWHFLEHYKHLPKAQKEKIKIVVLTTSLNPSDEARANSLEDVAIFQSKPLSKMRLKSILNQLFPDSFPTSS